MQRRKNPQHARSRLLSLLLAASLAGGMCTQALAAGREDGEMPPLTLAQADKNILAYALQEARLAVEAGLLDQLASSAPAGLKEDFLKAVEDAEAVYADPEATYAQIQGAYEDLQAVIWQLSYVQADKTALQKAVDSASAMDLNGYTSDSVQAVRQALEEAKALLARSDLNSGDQEQIAAAIQKLETAIGGLVKDSGSGSGSGGGGTVRPPKPEEKPDENPEEKPDEPVLGPVEVTYKDVSPEDWYAESVKYISSYGIMQGTGSETFSPNASTSRATVWTMLYRLAGSPEQGGTTAQAWYHDAMLWATENGVSDGSNPNDNVTREQLVVLIYRYFAPEKTVCDLSGFRDRGEISDWAEEAMMWAVETGLLNGKGDGTLDPKGTATRAEMAAIFTRFMQNFQNMDQNTNQDQ